MTDPAINDAVVATRQQVNEYLAEAFDDVEVTDGEWGIRYGSAKVTISVAVFDEDSSVVHVEAHAVTGATPSEELFRFLATDSANHAFGHLAAIETGDTVTITFGHSLLGEFLDSAELRTAVIAVAFTADRLDDELACRFGGSVHDASNNLSG